MERKEGVGRSTPPRATVLFFAEEIEIFSAVRLSAPREGGGPKGISPGLDWPLQGCARPTLKCPRAECGVYTERALTVNYSMHGLCLQ